MAKVSRVILDGITTDSIFDAESFCKKFFNRLIKVDHLALKSCKPMLIEKFFMFTAGALSSQPYQDNVTSQIIAGSRLSHRSHSASGLITSLPVSQNRARNTPLSSLQSFEISGTNLEQIETSLTHFLSQLTNL